MGNTLFSVFAIKTSIVINVLQTYGIDYQGEIIDSKCCHITLGKGFFYQQSREIPISQNSISQSWHTFIYYFLVSSDREQFFLCL